MMKCPYCGKRTNDMPDHLGKYKKCHEEHSKNLMLQLQFKPDLLAENARLRKIVDGITVESKQLANIIVNKIVADLSDRKGLRQEWEQIDDDIKNDIEEKWNEIIVAEMKGDSR